MYWKTTQVTLRVYGAHAIDVRPHRLTYALGPQPFAPQPLGAHDFAPQPFGAHAPHFAFFAFFAFLAFLGLQGFAEQPYEEQPPRGEQDAAAGAPAKAIARPPETASNVVIPNLAI